MTAIAGLYDRKGVTVASLEQMCSAMKERGRDGTSVWVADAEASSQQAPVGLGVCLLHATGEALNETQPQLSENGSIALVLDGYLANYDELRADLLSRSVALRNRSDAELVLRAYQIWGAGCAEHLDGEFAFVIVDLQQSEVICARDHRGLRPLFYHHDGERLVVASDLAAAVSQISPKPSPDFEYLAGIMADKWFDRDATPWAGIRRLRPAHVMRFAGGKLSFARHWSLKTDVTIRYASDEDYVTHYREVLIECVRRASRTHALAGYNVSGGLDSSAIFAIAHDLARRGKLPAPEIAGYTLLAEKSSAADEVDYARAVGVHLGKDLNEVPLTRPPLEWFDLQARANCDIPIATNGAMTRDLERQAVADGCRVLIGGDGGDEWLQGSVHYYRQFLSAGDLVGFARSLKTDAGVFGLRAASRVAARQAIAAIAPEKLLNYRRMKLRKQARDDPDHLFWLKPAFRQRLADLEEDYIASMPSEPVAWSKHHLVGSSNSDMAHTMMCAQYARAGLERRSPMLLKPFIEFSTATPEHIRARAGVTKYVHRRAMRGLLPDRVVDRQSKANFPSTELDNEFAKFALAEGFSALESIADPAGLQRLLAARQDGRIDASYSWEVWGVFACAAFLLNHA